MIHHSLLDQLRQDRRQQAFLYPDYGHQSIAEIGPTIHSLFSHQTERSTLPKEWFQSSQPIDRVILFIVDGLGYNHFMRYYRRTPFLERLARQGSIYPLTSVFPSTTAAALTALHTGLTPQEHGLPEWNVYFEEFDSIIETLPFRFWNTESDSLKKHGGTGAMLYQGPTVYQKLYEAGTPSFMFIFEEYAESVYSSSVHAGSQIVTFKDGEELIAKLHDKLRTGPQSAYYCLYWGKVDATAHEYGPDSPEHRQAIAELGQLMTDQFLGHLDKTVAANTLFLMTADHGHVNIQDEDIINLNKFPIIDKNLMTGSKGKRILPTGSPHDVFLFIEPSKVKEVVEFLQHELIGQAAVMTIDETLKAGLFGLNKPSEKFLKRIGNVLILPYTHHHVWYEFFPDIPYRQLGIHGGLSEDEMVVPLAVAQLDRLID